jgi:hypothetical protein
MLLVAPGSMRGQDYTALSAGPQVWLAVGGAHFLIG